MRLAYPSREFDETVAAVCHGTASDPQICSLNALLRTDAAARDEYILRVEVHARLASDPDLFAALTADSRVAASADHASSLSPSVVPLSASRGRLRRTRNWGAALAACVALLATGWWGWNAWRQSGRKGATSGAVAMLSRAVDARWDARESSPRLGAPLEPGWLRLKTGLAEIVFYSGARVMIEGPAELQLISPTNAACRSGRLASEVPPQARGFRVSTPQIDLTDLGTAFGLDVKAGRTELHVFKGSVEFQAAPGAGKQNLKAGFGAVKERTRPLQLITADRAPFAQLFDLQLTSSAADARRHAQWRAAGSRLDRDPSLLVHFDFEQADQSDWRLRNASARAGTSPDATTIGCQWVEGRWPEKRALEFQNVSDRVRLSVPGEFESLTLAAWVRVQGLDRQFSSLFMCDGFEAGTLHWLIRRDGVLGLTVIGSGSGDYQIVASPSVLTLDQFGIWVHLAVVIDGSGKRVAQYLNGLPVAEKALKIPPPFSVGAAELGNWNASGFSDNDPSLIRNFSGAIDEFCLFSRALNADEVRALYSAGRPQPDLLTQNPN